MLRDETFKELIAAGYDENYRCYGARKMWLQLRQAGYDVARCTVERLMRVLGLQGARRGQAKRTTFADPPAARAKDLVGRNFAPLAPNRLWVADFTYVSTLAGWVYVAFVIDAYARRILGWKVSTSMTTDLVLAAINQAIFTRNREGVKVFAGLVHHNDAGSQYTSVRFTERLLEEDRPVDVSLGHTPLTIGTAQLAARGLPRRPQSADPRITQSQKLWASPRIVEGSSCRLAGGCLIVDR